MYADSANNATASSGWALLFRTLFVGQRVALSAGAGNVREFIGPNSNARCRRFLPERAGIVHDFIGPLQIPKKMSVDNHGIYISTNV